MVTLGTRVDSVAGVVTTKETSGLSVAKDSSNVGFLPYKLDDITIVSTSTTLGPGDAGVTVMSQTSSITLTMPTAVSCPGAMFVFTCTNSRALQYITASQESPGRPVFADTIGSRGSLLTLSGTRPNVVVMSTGQQFLIMHASSGTLITGT